MTYTEKIYHEDNNIIRVRSTSIILLIFMSDYIFSVYVQCGMFYFYYPPFCMIYGLNNMNI